MKRDGEKQQHEEAPEETSSSELSTEDQLRREVRRLQNKVADLHATMRRMDAELQFYRRGGGATSPEEDANMYSKPAPDSREDRMLICRPATTPRGPAPEQYPALPIQSTEDKTTPAADVPNNPESAGAGAQHKLQADGKAGQQAPADVVMTNSPGCIPTPQDSVALL